LRRTEIIDRERRWARPAAIAAFGTFVLFVAGRIVASRADTEPVEDIADLAVAFATDDLVLIGDVIGAIGLAAFAGALLYLFRAAQARSDAVRPGLVGLVVAGPIFFGAASILRGIAFGDAGDAVLADPDACRTDDCIADLVAESSVGPIASGLQLAGAIGLAFALIYTSLHAQRTGLLTRFLGTFGIATGVVALLSVFGLPLSTLLLVLFAIGLGLVFAGWRPGGRPPAWEAGEAVPWPAPGERPSTTPGRDEEPVEGRAEEVFPDAAGGTDEEEPEERPRDAPEPGSIADEVERASERPQKRKRRQ
jgi:hypothetical protein